MTQPEPNKPAAGPRMGGMSCALIGLALLALALAGIRTIATPGIWTHIAVGHDIVQHGIPRTATLTFALPADTRWVDANWLYDLAVHGLWQTGGSAAGAALVTLAHVLCATIAFLLLALVAVRRGAEPWSAALALGVSAWLMMPAFSTEPLVVAIVFPALFLWLLSREASWPRLGIALLLVQLVWTNMHESFLLGPLLVALFAVDARRDEARGAKPTQPSNRLFMLAGLLLVVTLANPYAFGLHAWLASIWSDASRNITLSAAPAFSADFVPSLFFRGHYAAIAIILVGLVVIRQRLSVTLTGAALLGAFLMVRSASLAPSSVALALPFVALCLTAAAQAYPVTRLAGTVVAAALSAIVLFSAWTSEAYQRMALTSRFGLGVENEAYPADAAAVMSKAAFPTNCLNLAPDGGFLSVRMPGRTIFCDTRGSLYGAPFYDTFAQALLGDTNALHSLEERYHPGAIVLNCTWPLCGTAGRVLLAQGRWRLAYFDGSTALFLRNIPEHQQFILDRHLQQAGLDNLESSRAAYAHRRSSAGNGNSARLIGAGYFLIGMGHYREAEIVYRNLTRGTPSMIGAWRGLGIACYQLGQNSDALEALHKANRLKKNDPLTHLWLSRALRDAGRETEADAAVARARALNERLTDSFLKNPPPKPGLPNAHGA